MARMHMTPDLAESVAIDILTFLAEDDERLGRFLALTGLAPGSLRDAAREPGFLLGVLDYLVGDDPLLQMFAGEHEMPPETVVKARDVLANASPTDT